MIPASVRPILDRYFSLISQQFPGRVRGLYVVGSIALDEFNERFSDIDFVAVLDRELTTGELDSLAEIHRTVAGGHRSGDRWTLSGSYLQWDDLGRYDDGSGDRPYYHDGVLHRAGRFERNPVTWWLLKNHGLPLVGPSPQDLPFEVNWDALVAWMRRNLNSYWVSWTRRPGRLLALLSDWGIQWTVLGVLRQFYSFKENSITSKVRAGNYGLACLPARWHPIINEAINIRQGNDPSGYRTRIARALDTRRFLTYIIHTCNYEFATRPHRP